MTRIKRILAKIDERCVYVPGPLETPCHVWTGPTSGSGRGGEYGRMNLDGGTVSVHITSWVCKNGPIPPRKQLDHRCMNRRCREDAHLEMVTQKQNCRRRDEARRFRCEQQELRA